MIEVLLIAHRKNIRHFKHFSSDTVWKKTFKKGYKSHGSSNRAIKTLSNWERIYQTWEKDGGVNQTWLYYFINQYSNGKRIFPDFFFFDNDQAFLKKSFSSNPF